MLNLKKASIILISVLALVSAASALEFSTLEISVEENGDSTIYLSYKLSLPELIGYYTKIADPTTEIKKQFEKYSENPVDIISVSDTHLNFYVYNFAEVKSDNGSITYITPSMDFSNAEKILKEHWISAIISFDLSPEKSRVVFPDSYFEDFRGQIKLPSITHNT
ncbi:hypothetical protein F1737_06490 [Methanoplanus sp. FWC-SCC4]|uniref:Uncharacterized protein n=1 Tax=Methanochimaera problematica TaxID=2609417 RepID=A0AA97I4C8_9EURY|nr:hypothetical protein [Methanoplanus sp. FWC-SCC4]WOF16379.1 hypothetical protein F1737_06490 [Methanoplanus sp. FWC-SCC4]